MINLSARLTLHDTYVGFELALQDLFVLVWPTADAHGASVLGNFTTELTDFFPFSLRN